MAWPQGASKESQKGQTMVDGLRKENEIQMLSLRPWNGEGHQISLAEKGTSSFQTKAIIGWGMGIQGHKVCGPTLQV